MRNTFLTGSRVELVEIEERDLKNVTHGINDPDVTKYLMVGERMLTYEQEREWIASLYTRNDALVLGIWLSNEEKLIGNVSLNSINRRDQHATLGIVIYNTDHQGKGIGTEVITLILEHAFNRMNLHSIRLSVLGNNERAHRCYEKCGFIVIGTWPHAVFKEGAWYDEVLMVATRSN